jgi:hypothetical protein
MSHAHACVVSWPSSFLPDSRLTPSTTLGAGRYSFTPAVHSLLMAPVEAAADLMALISWKSTLSTGANPQSVQSCSSSNAAH